MNKILITGATGFIGKHLVDTFLRKNMFVRVLVRNSQNLTPHVNLEIIETKDIAADDNLAKKLAGINTIIHLSGLAHVKSASRIDYTFANEISTQKLLNAMDKKTTKRFIFLSSMAVYGVNKSAGAISEETPINPNSYYGASKHAAEKIVHGFSSDTFLSVSIRAPLVMAKNAKGNWARLEKLARSRLPLPFGSTGNSRNFVSIETLIKAILHVSDCDDPAGKSGSYNLCTHPAVSTTDIIKKLRQENDTPNRLLHFPKFLIRILSVIGPFKKITDQLWGDYKIDDTKFRKVFNFEDEKIK